MKQTVRVDIAACDILVPSIATQAANVDWDNNPGRTGENGANRTDNSTQGTSVKSTFNPAGSELAIGKASDATLSVQNNATMLAGLFFPQANIGQSLPLPSPGANIAAVPKPTAWLIILIGGMCYSGWRWRLG